MCEEDYITCPSCGSPVAVIVQGYGMEYASCRYDCGFKWSMLIEPDPDLFDQLGPDTPIIESPDLFDDIDDVERQYRILEWSDLGSSTDRGSKRTTPANIAYRRKRFFENLGKEAGIKEAEMMSEYIQAYVDDKSKLQNLLYVFSTCSMVFKRTQDDVIYKIEFNQFNANQFKSYSPVSIDEIRTLLKDNDDIFFVEVEYVPEENLSADKTKTFTKLYEDVSEEAKKISDKKGFYDLAMQSGAINHFLKPFVVDLDKYIEDIDTFKDFPSMIDLDNDLVYINISHRDLMSAILNDSNIAFTDFDNMENVFHQNFNMLQYAVSELSGNRLLTNSKPNLDRILPIFTEEIQSLVLDDMIDDFMVLNGAGVIEGEIYLPEPNEELSVPGKILVIPTSSEEYFLPALSAIDGVGCIITERGSRTSHLVSNSKEFNFNIILVDNALKRFKNGDKISIDLDKKIILNIES